MHLVGFISSRPPPPFLQLHHFSSAASFYNSEAPSGLFFHRGSTASVQLPSGHRERRSSIRCSISQVYSYGTVDYERRPALKWSSLYRKISTMEDASVGAASVLEKWEDEEKRLNKWDLCRVAKELRKFRRFKLALEVYEWMTAQGDRFNIYSSNAAIQLDLISKVRGISSAEDFFSKLPENLKDKRTYGALLNCYTHAKIKEKAEDVFETMRSKGYTTDSLPFNVIMTLYMNIGEHEKVNSIVTEMREKNIPLDMYTYNIWITTCAAVGDTEEMERVVEQMNSDKSINANWTTYTTLATMYIRLGNIEKAEKFLKDAEARLTGRYRTSFNYLLSLYSRIGKKEDVYRVWNWYKSSFPSILNLGYHAMLSSLVKLGDIDGAEEIYEEWLSTTSSCDPKIPNIMISWYVREGMVTKAEGCLDRMLDVGGKPNPNTWELLAEGHIKEKQTSKAVSCMKEAASVERPKNWTPRPSTVANFLVLCAEKNDTAGVEALVDVLRKARCLDNEEYKSLISTYAGAAVQGKTGAQEESQEES